MDSGMDASADSGDTGVPPVVDIGASVLERNNHPNRDGNFIEPGFAIPTIRNLIRDTTFVPTFPGALYGSPLYWEKGPGGKGLFFAATTGNDVFALAETTGAIVWQKNLGPSPTANGVPCGNIHPLGVVSTPVIDPVTETLFVAGAIGTTSIERHEVHAFSVMDGTERPGFPVVVTGTSGGTTFTPAAQNQRSALSLVNGILYVAYGGHGGDCGPYHGWVFGIDIKNPKKMGGWATLGQGEGIWATGGMASDGDGVFAITGNSTVGAADHLTSDSEQVVRITGLGVLNRVNKNLYFPGIWRTMDAQDADYGSSSPVYVSVPGSKPEHVLATVSKAGHFYLLDPANLGGMDGHLVDLPITSATGSVFGVPATFHSSTGVHVVLTTSGNAICPGNPGGRALMSILLSPGSPPKPTVEWCASAAGTTSAPMITTTDGSANAIVWYMRASSLLEGLDANTGALVYNGSNANTYCAARQWTAPIAVKNRIIVGADGGMCGWTMPN
jgi:outer membrane protein assembly factor BamB